MVVIPPIPPVTMTKYVDIIYKQNHVHIQKIRIIE